MEPKLVRKDIKSQKKTLIIVSVLVVCLFIGGSFSLLSNSDETEEVVTFKTGDLNMEVKTTGTLSLEGELPKSYDDGFKSNDITLTLTNTGSLEIGKYEVKLEGDTGTTLESNYIRYSVSDDDGKTYLASKLLSDTNNIIYTGYSLKDTKTLKLKIWIDENAGETALKKSYNGNINVELYQNEDTLVDVVKSKLVSNYSGGNESFQGGVVGVNTNGELYHETNDSEIREYRYSGPSVNNYVTFNDEVWRIIGVFKEGEEEFVKIVKNEYLNSDVFPLNYSLNNLTYQLKSQETDDIVFWNNNNGENTNINDWSRAGLMYFLNTDKDNLGQNGYQFYLNNDAKNMIRETIYYLGNVTFFQNDTSWGIDETAISAYKNERATTICSQEITNNSQDNNCYIWYNNSITWKGKVGLMYPSDIAYSSNSSNWSTYKLLSNQREKSQSSWIKTSFIDKISQFYWLISPTSSGNNLASAYRKWDDNSIFVDRHMPYSINDRSLVHPALYLKSKVKITTGDGSQQYPFQLIMD